MCVLKPAVQQELHPGSVLPNPHIDAPILLGLSLHSSFSLDKTWEVREAEL